MVCRWTCVNLDKTSASGSVMSKSIESVWSTVKSQIYRVLWKSGVCFIGRFSVSKAEEIREMIWNVAVYGQQQNHQWKSIFWLARLKSIDIAYRESETIRITITIWIIKRRRREKTTKSKGTFYCEYENVVLFSWNIFLYFGFFGWVFFLVQYLCCLMIKVQISCIPLGYGVCVHAQPGN